MQCLTKDIFEKKKEKKYASHKAVHKEELAEWDER